MPLQVLFSSVKHAFYAHFSFFGKLERRHCGLHGKGRELPQPARQRGYPLRRALDYERDCVRFVARHAHSADDDVRKSDSTFCISSTVSRSPLSTMPTTPIRFISFLRFSRNRPQTNGARRRTPKTSRNARRYRSVCRLALRKFIVWDCSFCLYSDYITRPRIVNAFALTAPAA